MAGFLDRLEKKGRRAKTGSTDLLVERGTMASDAQVLPPPKKITQIISTDHQVGDPEALLRALQAESHQHTIPEHRPQSPSTLTAKSLPAAISTKVRIVQSERPNERRRSELFDDALPWWLTEPSSSSPQVDLLVPAARFTLNDLITEQMGRGELAEAIQKAVSLAADKLSIEVRFSAKDIQESISELTSLMMGKGPLQALYDDPNITDIHIDRYNSIKCIRRGHALETPFRFRSPGEYEAYVTAMLQSVDRVLNMSSPIVDCVLNDKWRSRVSAIHASLLDSDEPGVVIRVPRLQQVSFYDLLRTKTLPATVAAWLAELVAGGEANILVIGPTGSGKTTLTTALLSSVGSDERVVTIEDVPEIFVPTTHLEKLVSRPDNAQGEGSVGMEKLLRAALRRAPHRIVVGEIRDKEGPLFLKALETGHAGSVATIHAETARDGLWRLLDVVAAYETAPQESIQRRIARSLHILISLRKINGRPCLLEVAEVYPPVKGEFVIKPLVQYDTEVDGKRQWRLLTRSSHWISRVAKRGLVLETGVGLVAQDTPGADEILEDSD